MINNKELYLHLIMDINRNIRKKEIFFRLTNFLNLNLINAELELIIQ